MRSAQLLLAPLCGLLCTFFVGAAGAGDAAKSPSTHKTSTSKKMTMSDTAPKVLLETSLGNITLELDATKAPKSVANFVAYVKDGHYDGTVFHRVIKGFMIQGGGYDEKGYGEKSTKAPVENESTNGLPNLRGTVAMARTNDPHSATAQFFINHSDNDFLNAGARGQWGYAVFGKVVEGMDVVDAIANTPTGRMPPFGQDMPVTKVVIKKASIVG
jgi:cyclophilin family peptidyl-prolyl cis-trans isomerase